MRLLVIGEDPFLSTDIYRYVWDGRVQARRHQPLPLRAGRSCARRPARRRHLSQHQPRRLRHDLYPPVAQVFFLAVTRISESLSCMRLAMVACEIVIVARDDRPAAAVAAAGDGRGRLGLASAGDLGDRQQRACRCADGGAADARRLAAGAQPPSPAGVLMALAALVKPYAIVALPAFWRPWDWRVPLAVVATIALCYLPYLGAGRGVLGFCSRRLSRRGRLRRTARASGWSRWRAHAFGDVPGLTVAYLLVAAGMMAGSALRAACAPTRTPETTLRDIAVLLMAGLFFLSPNYPWYFLAVVPFIALGGGAPAWAMTLARHPALPPLILPDNDLALENLAMLPFVIAVASTLLARGAHSREHRSIAMDELTTRTADSQIDARRYFEAGAQARPASPTSRRSASTWRSPTAATCCAPPARAPTRSWSRRPTCRGSCSPRIVDQVPDLSRAVLHGVGEPMLVKNLPQMVRYLKDRGAYVLFNTNGTVLNEKNGRALIAAGLDELRVSLDASTPKSYLKVRGKDYFRPHPAEREGVPRPAGARGPRQAARVGLADRPQGDHRRSCRPSCGSPPRSASRKSTCSAWCSSIATRSAWRGPIRRCSSSMNRDEARLPATRPKRSRKSLGLTFSASGAASEPGISLAKKRDDSPWSLCRRPWTVMYFTANGRALPCCIAPFSQHGYENYTLGDATQESLREIWNGPRYQAFREGAAVRHAAAGLRQLRPALEPVTMQLAGASAIVSVVIPCLDEEEPIAGVVREVLAQGVDEVIVVDNGSRDATAERAARGRRARRRRAAARLWPRLRGRRRAVRADAEIVCFLDGDGSDVPRFHGRRRRSGRARRGRFRHGLAPARPARARQHDAAAARRRLAGGRADAARLWRALHRHVAVPRHARRSAARGSA